MSAQSEKARDLLVYFALSALPIAGFLLLGQPGADFDVALLTVSLLVMLWFKTYYKDASQLVDYDEPLHGESFVWITLGIIGTLAISTYLTSTFMKLGTWTSSIWVPTTTLGLSVGSVMLPKFASDVLYTLTLVAPAEECSKLISSLGIYMQFKDMLGKGTAKVLAISVPIALWALLHTYQNPVYQQYATILVPTAFLSGLLFYYVMQKTHSLLSVILVHGTYNCIVIYLTQYAGLIIK
jgi:membrane protease YdiL (CAAX protease family)